VANGFVGIASRKYFQELRNTSQMAGSLTVSAGGKSPPNMAGVGEGQGYRLNVGASENIVMKEDVYRDCLAQIQQLDELMAERIEQTVRQMDDMCKNIFIVPETTPRVQAVLGEIRGSLSEFRDVTTQTTQITQMYTSQIRAADR